MSSSRLLVLFVLVIMAISYEPFSLMGVNASENVPSSCDHNCNQTFESRHHEEIAHRDVYEEDVKVSGYKIYGFPYSANTRRVLAVLHEKGLSYEPITVDLRSGEEKKPLFLSINPFGLVPVMLDGNLKLTESRAISEYIANVHRSRGTQLLNHNNHKAMGIQAMWTYVESLEFDPPATKLTLELAIKPLMGLKPDQKVVNETEPVLEKILDIYEERLKKSRFLAGKKFTLADLYHLPNIQYLMDTPSKRLFENRPSVRRWVAKITARPAWKKACDVKAWYHK